MIKKIILVFLLIIVVFSSSRRVEAAAEYFCTGNMVVSSSYSCTGGGSAVTTDGNRCCTFGDWFCSGGTSYNNICPTYATENACEWAGTDGDNDCSGYGYTSGPQNIPINCNNCQWVCDDPTFACSTNCGQNARTEFDACSEPHSCPATEACCTPGTDWQPEENTVCLGVPFTQTESTCNTTRTVDGTKTEAQTCTSSGIELIETPQHTGSIWARIYGVSADASSVSFPTWSSFNGQDDIQWYAGSKVVPSCTSNCTWGASINLTNHPVSSSVGYVDVDSYIDGCGTTNNSCSIGGFTITDKTCSVAVTPLGGKNFSVTVSGDGSLNPGTQTGRLWVERQDTSQVPNYATEIIPATVEAHNPGAPYYYNFTSANFSSTNSAVDSKTINVTLPGGNYYFHCDMPEDIGTNFVKCSGNPFCSYEGLGGGLTCTNWKSCSNNDWAAVCSEGQTCALRCNQAKDCGGFCTGEDAGTPAAPIVVSPLGSSLNPVILTDTTPLLDWSGSDPLTDSYEIVVINPSNAVVWTGTTTAATTSISVGTALTNNITYRWYARALNSTCSPYGQNLYSLPSGFGYFRINSPPTIGDFYIFNSGNTMVEVETGSRNHICQNEFNSSRLVNFRLNVGDSDGVNDIAEVTLNWNENTYVLGRGATWATGATFSTTINYGTYDDPGVYEITATAVDVSHQSTSEGTGRNWKVWNCEVPTNGHVYDGSADHSCLGGFSNLADLDMDFRALEFNNASGSVTATVTVPNAFGTDNLIWGRNYLPLINGGLPPNPDGDLAATGRLTRLIGPGVPVGCLPNNMVNTSNIDAYSPAPSAQVDFSFIRDQESWYQVRGGGIRAGDSIQSGVPVTANPLERYLTLGKSLPTTINNGLVSYAVNFSNTNGYNDEAYGSPNSWWKNSSLLPATRYGYQYFYNNLFVKAGVGVTGKTWDEKPSEGVFFVNGNLTIDSNFVLPADRFFMVVVSGSITITNGVTQIDGIYVSDGEISATGNSNNALEINGMLYSRSSVRLARSFTDKTLNNTSPATIVNYRPSLLFNMPIKISKVISGWRED